MTTGAFALCAKMLMKLIPGVNHIEHSLHKTDIFPFVVIKLARFLINASFPHVTAKIGKNKGNKDW
jgi:hypothetical protein